MARDALLDMDMSDDAVYLLPPGAGQDRDALLELDMVDVVNLPPGAGHGP